MRVRGFTGLAAAIVLSVSVSTSASAQWSGSVYGSAEADTESGNMLFAGMSLGPNLGDISPIFGVQGYRLYYKSGTVGTTVYGFKPSAGLRFRFSGGSATTTVGYAFADKDVTGPLVGARDQGEGVVLAGGLNLNPSASNWAWEGLGSYNFGSESFWGRAKGATKIRDTETGSWHLAPQVSFLNGRGYSAVEPGVMAEFHAVQGLSWAAGLGYRLPSSGSNALVFKVEASQSLF